MTDKQLRQSAYAEVQAARANLVDTLNQLEDAVNLPKRAARWLGRSTRQAKEFAADKPAAALGYAAAAVGLIGAAVTLIVKRSRS